MDPLTAASHDSDEASNDLVQLLDAPSNKKNRSHRRHHTTAGVLLADTTTSSIPSPSRRSHVRRSSLLSKRAMTRKTNPSYRQPTHSQQQDRIHQSSALLSSCGNSLRDLKLSSSKRSSSGKHHGSRSLSPMASRGGQTSRGTKSKKANGSTRRRASIHSTPQRCIISPSTPPTRGKGASTCDEAILQRIQYHDGGMNGHIVVGGRMPQQGDGI